VTIGVPFDDIRTDRNHGIHGNSRPSGGRTKDTVTTVDKLVPIQGHHSQIHCSTQHEIAQSAILRIIFIANSPSRFEMLKEISAENLTEALNGYVYFTVGVTVLQ